MEKVSIIIPCLNEEKTIAKTLDGIYAQGYASDSIEVLIADGLSHDRTRHVITEYTLQHPDLKIRVLDNTKRTIPSGLNLAIRSAEGAIILRLDAHSIPEPDYVEKCVQDLQAGLGQNVGGVWNIVPGEDTWIANSIAEAAASRLGAGDAHYRTKTAAGPVDTVPFGAFRIETLQKFGGYNEELLANEDYEFNTRIRQAGGIIWLDPEIRCTYFARSTFLQLARQYRRYGYWKAMMLKRYPGTIRWRQALPPMFVSLLILLVMLSVINPWFFPFLAGITGIYLGILLVYGIKIALIKHYLPFIIGIPLSIGTMHMSWGTGFIAGLFTKTVRSN